MVVLPEAMLAWKSKRLKLTELNDGHCHLSGVSSHRQLGDHTPVAPDVPQGVSLSLSCRYNQGENKI